MARRLSRQRVVDGGYRLDDGALRDDFLSFLQELGVVDGLGASEDTASQRAMVPVVQVGRRSSVKAWLGSESRKAWPPLLCSEEALRRQQAGLKAALVWLTPEGQAAMVALRQPGETVDAFFNRALVTWQQVMANGTSPALHPKVDHEAQASAVLLALLQVLLPAGERRYLRDIGIATLPLAQLNTVLAPLGYVLVGTKTRAAGRFVRCTDAYGEIEKFGLFALRRIAEEAP